MLDLVAQVAQLPALFSLHDLTQWLSPDYMLTRFGGALFWVGIVVLFIECGLFFPFLPGDTLLFAMGLFIAEGKVDVLPGSHFVDFLFVMAAYCVAAFLGNIVGYEIGVKIGPAIYQRDGKIVKRKYLDQTSDFFEKHGHSALVGGRFVPFVRTYITLVAGVTRMDRGRFFLWSGLGALIWVISITSVGYGLGKTFPQLGKYIDLLTYGLLGFTVLLLGFELWRARKVEKADAARAAAAQQTDS